MATRLWDARPDTPASALRELLAGNDRFVSGERVHPHQDAERRAEIVAAQRPFAVVFGCSDSRLAAEIIFDRGLGDLFVVRTAGHIIGPEVLASIEYGVGVLGVPLLVVLGHDSCGAVRAAHDAVHGGVDPPPGLRAIVERIRPSIRLTPGDDQDAVGATHVRLTVDALRANGAIAAQVAQGRCAVVGMTYRLARGRVSVLTGATR